MLALQGREQFWFTGLSGLAIFYTPNYYLTGMKFFPITAWLLFLASGALIFVLVAFGGWLYQRIHRYSPWAFSLLFPALITSVEFLPRTWLAGPGTLLAYPLAGFPPLIQIASITGVWGAEFMVLFAAALTAAFFHQQGSKRPEWFKKLGLGAEIPALGAADEKKFWIVSAATAGVLGVLLLAGNLESAVVYQMSKKPDRSLTTALLQGNVEPGMRDASLQRGAVDYYRPILLEAAKKKVDLVVFPEGALPARFPQDREFWNYFQGLLKEAAVPGVFGLIAMGPGKQEAFNTWYLTDSQGAIRDFYVKQFLVPFGEYLPGRAIIDPIVKAVNYLFDKTYQLFRLTAIDLQDWDLTPGKSAKVFALGDRKFSVKVCDEILHSGLLRKDVRRGAEVVISPAAGDWFPRPWYFRTYLLLSAFRAVEARRWICRVTNMNAAVTVDALGSIRATTEFGKTEVQIQKVPLLTMKSFYMRFGDLFAWLCVLLTVGFLIPAMGAKRPRA